MLDIKLLRENPEIIRKDLEKRNDKEKQKLLDETIKLDEQWRSKLKEAEELKRQRNVLSKKINELKKAKQNADAVLKEVKEEYTKGMEAFAKREYSGALKLFDTIIDKYKDTEFFSVAEIQTRAKVYRNICHSQMNPVEIKLETDEDYLNEGVFSLNAGNYDRALELFNELENRKYKDLYLSYLLSIVYLKKDDIETCLKHLKKCIKKDNFFKIIAYNEPDFAKIFEEEEFRSIVE